MSESSSSMGAKGVAPDSEGGGYRLEGVFETIFGSFASDFERMFWKLIGGGELALTGVLILECLLKINCNKLKSTKMCVRLQCHRTEHF